MTQGPNMIRAWEQQQPEKICWISLASLVSSSLNFKFDFGWVENKKGRDLKVDVKYEIWKE